jgi:acetyl esterase
VPLDPQVQTFLDELKALDPPPFETLTPEEARRICIAEIETLGTPQVVAEVRDFSVPGPGGEIPVRLYKPENSDEGALPVLVYFHGGGWVVCNLDTHDTLCRQLANAVGCAVVAVDYRLAPEHKYPAAAEDSYAATKWVAENAQTFGGDPDRVAVGGDSAGGNLATVVSLMARDRGPFMPVCQILLYPVTDHNFDRPSYRENAEGYVLTRSAMDWFWDHYLDCDEDGQQAYASPIRAETLVGLPPALVITSEYDPLRDEGEAYAARLRESGVAVQHTRYQGMIHPFIRRTAIFDKAKVAQKEIADMLKSAFWPE